MSHETRAGLAGILFVAILAPQSAFGAGLARQTRGPAGAARETPGSNAQEVG